jgi:hypothetical protein
MLQKWIVSMLCGVFLFSSYTGVNAQEELDKEKLKALCNKTMVNIYNDLLEAKSKYSDLKHFNVDSLTKDENGVYVIEYEAKEKVLGKYSRERTYAIGVSIIDINDTRYRRERGSRKKIFEYGFPLLGIKFQGYRRKGLRSKEFDIQASVQKNGKLLLMEQDKYLPLELILESQKEAFKVNEDIKFDVTIKNRGGQSYKIKDLNSQTLFFVYGDNTTWGAQQIGTKKYATDKYVLLKPGRSVTKTFAGSGFDIPKEYEISCFYVMTFSGVNPSGLLNIKVEK